jgi:hypothetical protein
VDRFPVSDGELRRRRECELYEAAVGREPARLPEDHPDAWQWEYRGSRQERDELLERLTGCEGVLVEQESLSGIAA